MMGAKGILTALMISAIASPAVAGERTVTLSIEKMVCAVCAYTVKKSLESVAGVSKASVSLREKNAVVVFDDAKTDVNALISATARAGFPSAPQN
jgi:mercuric ion binding protein